MISSAKGGRLILLLLLIEINSLSLCLAQTNTASDTSPLQYGPFTFGAFIDSYAAHDFNNPPTLDRPYTTQPLHEDQLDINLGFIEAKLSSENWRGRLAVQHGTSVSSNYAAEEDIFWRYIQESVVGYKLSDKLWIDGGIYLSHIGFESFNSRDNWTYTRSLVAEFSPYYQTGVRLNYQFSDTTTGQFHVLRGWQNISNEEDPGFGLQLSHALTDKVQLTYANYVGDVSGAGTRYFNDFIGKVDVTDRFSLAAQVDVGAQDRSFDGGTVWWHGWSLMSRYKLSPSVALVGRVERFDDPHQVVLTTLNGARFNATGLSLGFDIELCPKVFWRNEYRVFLGRNDVFPKEDEGRFSKDDEFVVTSLSYSL